MFASLGRCFGQAPFHGGLFAPIRGTDEEKWGPHTFGFMMRRRLHLCCIFHGLAR